MIILSIYVECEDPGTPINGSSHFGSTAIGMYVTYDCDEGLVLDGDKSRKCSGKGFWSGSVPVCKCMYVCM